MHIILEVLILIFLMTYYYLEALISNLIPAKYRRKNIAGETVLVTGAGSGIGRLMSIRFAVLECTMVLWDINKEANEETANLVRKCGARAFAYQCDLSKREDIYKTADMVKQDVGEINILVNNAGIVTGKKFMQCPDHLIEKTMEVNTNAHFWTVKAFLPAMLERNHGHIVNIASSAGIIGVTGLADYCASKHGAVGFDESLRFELEAIGKEGVHTTVVCPYFINTGMFDGVTTRFPAIMPIVEPDYAVNKIMNAVLTNQQVLYIPWVLYFFLGLKGLMPVKVQSLMLKFFGATNSMDDFKGRTKID